MIYSFSFCFEFGLASGKTADLSDSPGNVSDVHVESSKKLSSCENADCSGKGNTVHVESPRTLPSDDTADSPEHGSAVHDESSKKLSSSENADSSEKGTTVRVESPERLPSDETVDSPRNDATVPDESSGKFTDSGDAGSIEKGTTLSVESLEKIPSNETEDIPGNDAMVLDESSKKLASSETADSSEKVTTVCVESPEKLPSNDTADYPGNDATVPDKPSKKLTTSETTDSSERGTTVRADSLDPSDKGANVHDESSAQLPSVETADAPENGATKHAKTSEVIRSRETVQSSQTQNKLPQQQTDEHLLTDMTTLLFGKEQDFVLPLNLILLALLVHSTDECIVCQPDANYRQLRLGDIKKKAFQESMLLENQDIKEEMYVFLYEVVDVDDTKQHAGVPILPMYSVDSKVDDIYPIQGKIAIFPTRSSLLKLATTLGIDKNEVDKLQNLPVPKLIKMVMKNITSIQNNMIDKTLFTTTVTDDAGNTFQTESPPTKIADNFRKLRQNIQSVSIRLLKQVRSTVRSMVRSTVRNAVRGTRTYVGRTGPRTPGRPRAALRDPRLLARPRKDPTHQNHTNNGKGSGVL